MEGSEDLVIPTLISLNLLLHLFVETKIGAGCTGNVAGGFSKVESR
jgi:hypothetical protein